MPWGPAYYREEDTTRRTQNNACARCRTVAELCWSAGALVCIGCLPTPTVADRGVWQKPSPAGPSGLAGFLFHLNGARSCRERLTIAELFVFDAPRRHRLELDTDLSAEPVSWVAQDQTKELRCGAADGHTFGEPCNSVGQMTSDTYSDS